MKYNVWCTVYSNGAYMGEECEEWGFQGWSVYRWLHQLSLHEISPLLLSTTKGCFNLLMPFPNSGAPNDSFLQNICLKEQNRNFYTTRKAN